ncbi:MAG: Heimdall-CTERM domain-containing surface protein [Candidatus Hodarchaeales archaeon]|jgi:hypothetical protein
MKVIKSLRFVSLCLVILLLVLHGTNSAYSATKGWEEGDTYKWGMYATMSLECDQDGQITSTDWTIESIQHQTIHELNETAQTINVSSLLTNSPEMDYNEFSYNASYFGASLGSIIDGDFYLEKDTGKFIVADLYGGIGGTGANFVDPQWDIINTELKEAFNTSNIIGTARNLTSENYGPYYYYFFTLADLLGNVTSYKLMGQDNWDDGLAKITNSTRSWSLELDISSMARESEWDSATQSYEYSTAYEKYIYKMEFGFNNDGIAESAKSEQETTITNNDITCTTKAVSEMKLGGLPASGISGFELFSMLVILSTLAIIIKRKRH